MGSLLVQLEPVDPSNCHREEGRDLELQLLIASGEQGGQSSGRRSSLRSRNLFPGNLGRLFRCLLDCRGARLLGRCLGAGLGRATSRDKRDPEFEGHGSHGDGRSGHTDRCDVVVLEHGDDLGR
ncbi:MAG: hypothetical protein U0R78_05310 [Nocardioidaceae bacterium]